MNKSKYEYDNIISLAKKNNFKKIMIMRNSWNNGNWCIVNKISINKDGKYGEAYGHIHYASGDKTNGNIPCAGTYAWRVIKVFEENMEVEYK